MSTSLPTHRPYRSLSTSAWILMMWVAAGAVVLALVFHVCVLVVAGLGPATAPSLRDTVLAIRSRPANPVGGYEAAPGPEWVIYTLWAVVVVALVVGGFWVATIIGRYVIDKRLGRTTPRDLRAMQLPQAMKTAERVLAKTGAPSSLAAARAGPAPGRVDLVKGPRRPAASGTSVAVRPPATKLLIPVGSLRGKELYAQHEDSFLVLAPPRTGGKTSNLAVGWVLDAPGPVVTTFTKNDLVYPTILARKRLGHVDVLDESGIVGWPNRVQWNPVPGCLNPEEALERGRGWAAADPAKGKGKNSEWFSARAGEVLAYLLHAAALKPGGSMRDVVRWGADFADNEPINILRDGGTTTDDADPRNDDVAAPAPDLVDDVDFGTRSWADLLRARTQSRAGETTDSLAMTLSGILAPLTSPKILKAVCPPPGTGFDVEEFLSGPNTLYLGSGKGSGNVAPLVTTLTDLIVRTALIRSQHSPGGRLWPPLRLVLDEAANVAPLPDLPSIMSDSGGRGITTMVICQSHAQMDERWGPEGAEAIRAAATCRYYLPGINEPERMRHVSDATGRYRARRVSVSSGDGRGSTQTSSEWENVMTVDDIRRMNVGTGLMFYRHLKGAPVQLTPWWERPDADALAADVVKVEKMTGRSMD